jgi:putative nucleotidyltransferase with HDIG domain
MNNLAKNDTSGPSQLVEIDLRHIIMMIARALDYVGVDDFNHGHRVAYIAYRCAQQLGWSESRQEYIFFAGLLHDCGVSSTSEHMRLLGGMEPEGAESHCVRGAKYLNSSAVLRPFVEPVRYHHTKWDILVDMDIEPAERDSASLLCLADRVDFLRARYMDENHPDSVILHGEHIADNVLAHSGTVFNPAYCEAMSELSRIEGFWFSMDQSFIEDAGMSMGGDGSYHMPLDIEEVINVAMTMSKIVDAKSPFTFEHSSKVASIAKELADDLGYSIGTQQQILVAGLLHDVGKLRVPDGILHKPEKLDQNEFSTMKRHAVDTQLALRYCFKDSSIPDWASNHHEKLDGSGYPFHLKGDQLDQPSRIIATADIFQALAQNRPYRGRLTYNEIMEIMQAMVSENKIDGDVLGLIQKRPLDYYHLATEG